MRLRKQYYAAYSTSIILWVRDNLLVCMSVWLVTSSSLNPAIKYEYSITMCIQQLYSVFHK
jgi:hypothetical protein